MQNTATVVPLNLTNPARPALFRGEFNFRQLADVYFAGYSGKDVSIVSRVKAFIELLGDRLAHEIDGDDIRECLYKIEARGGLRYSGDKVINTGKPITPVTLNRYRAAIQAVLSYARKKGLMPRGWTNPVLETERNPENNGRTRYLKSDEYEKLLKTAHAAQWKKLPVLIKFAVQTGLRRGAIESLTWANIDLDQGIAFVEVTKNGDPHVSPLTPDLVAELRHIKGSAADDHIVFCERNPYRPNRFDKAYKSALERAKITGVNFHTLRHTHASWLASSGCTLLEIAESMGHRSLTMTRRYSHLCVNARAQRISSVFAA